MQGFSLTPTQLSFIRPFLQENQAQNDQRWKISATKSSLTMQGINSTPSFELVFSPIKGLKRPEKTKIVVFPERKWRDSYKNWRVQYFDNIGWSIERPNKKRRRKPKNWEVSKTRKYWPNCTCLYHKKCCNWTCSRHKKSLYRRGMKSVFACLPLLKAPLFHYQVAYRF